MAKNPRNQTVQFGPFTGGVNRALAKDKLSPNELYDASGVYQNDRGSLDGCFETIANVVDFPDAAKTITGQKKIPQRVIYWPDAGKMVQLLSTDYAGATSIRIQDIDREYDNYDATAVIYRGYLILCGSGEQALAVHSSYYANTTVDITAFTYTTGTGVVSAITFDTGTIESLVVGDIWELANGNRYAITDVRHGYSGTAFTYTSGTGVVSAITFGAGFNIGCVSIGDVVTLNGTPSTVTAVSPTGGTFTVASGLGAIASGNFSSPSQFTVASGLGTIASGAATIERFRPVRLGSAYYTTGTVTVSNGGKIVTGSGTTWTSNIAAGQYITFSDSGSATWSMTEIQGYTGTAGARSYKVKAVVSDTVLTLEDEYEGDALSGDAYRCATTALQVNLPFVYKDRLFAVGANTTTQDYNTLYWSGFPGATADTSDIFDWLWWVQGDADLPIGLSNSGAIQRGIGFTDRMVVFCQNALYEVRGTPPIDAAENSELSDRLIADGIGATTYDSVCVGPDGQTIYFASPDGLFRLAGYQVDPIDQKIRNHELYQTGQQYTAYHEGRIYFTDGEDHPELCVTAAGLYRGVRAQFCVTWALDLQSGSWTYDQRVSGDPATDYDYTALYPIGYHGGVFSPYRGDLTQVEACCLSTPGGLVRYNYAPDARSELIDYHAARVVPAMPVLGNSQPKKIKGVALLGEHNESRSITLYAVPGRLQAQDSPSQDYAHDGKYITRQTTEKIDRGQVAGSGGRGRAYVSVALNHFEDVHHASSIPTAAALTDTTLTLIDGAYSYTGGASDYLASLLVPDSAWAQTMRVSWLLRISALSVDISDTNLAFHILNSAFAPVDTVYLYDGGLTLASQHQSGDYYWISAYINSGLLTVGQTYYLALSADPTITLAVPYYTAAAGYNLKSVTGGTPSTVQASARPIFLVGHIYGKCGYVDQLDGIEVDVQTTAGGLQR